MRGLFFRGGGLIGILRYNSYCKSLLFELKPVVFFPDHISDPNRRHPRSSTSVHSSSESLEQSQTTEQDSSTASLIYWRTKTAGHIGVFQLNQDLNSLSMELLAPISHTVALIGAKITETPSNFISNGPNSSQGVSIASRFH